MKCIRWSTAACLSGGDCLVGPGPRCRHSRRRDDPRGVRSGQPDGHFDRAAGREVRILGGGSRAREDGRGRSHRRPAAGTGSGQEAQHRSGAPDDDTSAADYAKTAALLQSKRGADFDRAYLRHEVAFHQSVVDAMKATLMPAIKNHEIEDLFEAVLPGFERHLAATRALARKMGVS